MSPKKPPKYFYSLPALISTVNCQSTSGTIFGIGTGTFIIIIAIVFSMLWCLACRNSSKPEFYSVIGIVIPVILILVFIFMPKQVDRPVTTGITDSNFIPHIVFLVIAIIGTLLALIFLLLNEIFSYKKAKNIAMSAFAVKEEEQERLNTGYSHLQGGQIQQRQGSSMLGRSQSRIGENEKPLRL